MTAPQFNEKDVRKFYNMLAHDNETEIRAIKKGKPTIQQHCTREDAFVQFCRHSNALGYEVYAGVHERKPGGTKEEDVKNIRYFWIDVDRKRGKDTPATEKQLKEMLELIKNVHKSMKDRSFKQPTIICSGNGYHVYWSINPILFGKTERETIKKNYKQLGLELKREFDTNDYEIDEQPFNLQQPPRVPGTTNKKYGDQLTKIVEYHAGEIADVDKLFKKPVKKEKKKKEQTQHEENKGSIEGLEYPCIQKLLYDNNPTHTQRLNLALLLTKSCNLSEEKAVELILNNAKWDNLNKAQTKTQVKSLKEYKKPPKKESLGEYCTKDCIDCVYNPIELLINPEGTDARELSNMIIPPTTWTAEKLLIKGQLTILTGFSGHNKTWVALEAGRSIAAGQNVFGFFGTEKGKVLYFDDENGREILARRLQLYDKEQIPDKGDLTFYCYSDIDLTSKTWLLWLEKKIRTEKPALIVFDSFAGTLGKTEQNSAEQMRPHLSNLQRITKKYGLSCFLIHHPRKPQKFKGHYKTRPEFADEIRGSSELRNVVDGMVSVWCPDPKKHPEHVEICDEKRRGVRCNQEPWGLDINIDDEAGTITFEQAETIQPSEVAAEKYAKLILEFMQKKKKEIYNTQELTEYLGVEKSTFYNATTKGKEEGWLSGWERGKKDMKQGTWKLAEGGQKTLKKP